MPPQQPARYSAMQDPPWPQKASGHVPGGLTSDTLLRPAGATQGSQLKLVNRSLHSRQDGSQLSVPGRPGRERPTRSVQGRWRPPAWSGPPGPA